MNKTIQWLIAGLLVANAVLQLTVITQIKAMNPEPTRSKQEGPRIPSLDEINEKIMHWTMHHGQHFSSKSQVSSLESNLETKLSEIDKKLDVLGDVVRSKLVER